MIKIKQTGQYYEMSYEKTNGSVMKMLAGNEDELASLLVSAGVSISDVIFCFETMEEKGHNYAEFGWMGGFVASQFVGKIQ